MAQSNSLPLSAESPVDALAKTAGKRFRELDYAGDITPAEAYAFISENEAVVVDVRSVPEWQFVGVPQLAETRAQLATISWKNYPDFAQNQRFAEQVDAIAGIHKHMPLLFLCRSGGRSLDAAVAMTACGYQHCFNIEEGFEGDPDVQSHRGVAQGWKARKLPWKQG